VPGGIGFAPSGTTVELGGVRLSAAVGTYPQLVISAAPSPIALWLGGLTFVGGLIFAYATGRMPPAMAKAAVVLAAIALSSCTRVSGAGTPSEQRLHSWTIPDTVRIGMYEEPDSLNPVIGSMAFAGDVFQLEYRWTHPLRRARPRHSRSGARTADAPKRRHLARRKDADLSLDARRCAGTTASR
jgi:hypothetical protein